MPQEIKPPINIVIEYTDEEMSHLCAILKKALEHLQKGHKDDGINGAECLILSGYINRGLRIATRRNQG